MRQDLASNLIDNNSTNPFVNLYFHQIIYQRKPSITQLLDVFINRLDNLEHILTALEKYVYRPQFLPSRTLPIRSDTSKANNLRRSIELDFKKVTWAVGLTAQGTNAVVYWSNCVLLHIPEANRKLTDTLLVR